MNNKTTYLLLIYMAACFALTQSAQAQYDTEFWFAVPDLSDNCGSKPTYFRFTAGDQPADVRISMEANPAFEPIQFTLAANEQRSLNMELYLPVLENNRYDSVMQRGLLITSDQPVMVYYDVRAETITGELLQSEMFTLKGRAALGQEFITYFNRDETGNYQQNSTFNGVDDAWSSIDMVAVYDETIVQIDPASDVFGHGKTSFYIKLNRGETYSARAQSVYSKDNLSGTYIHANQPIAVSVKDDCSMRVYDDEPSDYEQPGLMGDQILPFRSLGTEYVFHGAYFETGSYHFPVNITATEDSTVVKGYWNVDTNPLETILLNKGESVEMNTVDDYYVSGKPVYATVAHHMNVLKPYLATLSPVSPCAGSPSYSIEKMPNSFARNNQIEITVPAGGEYYFQTNFGYTIVPEDFMDVAGTNGAWKVFDTYYDGVGGPWEIANQLDTFQGSVFTVSNTEYNFQLNYYYRKSDTVPGIHEPNSVAQFSGFPLNFPDTIVSCGPYRLSAPYGRSEYLWNTGATTNSIIADSTGWYWVEASKNNCFESDSVFVLVKTTSDVSLQEDSVLCETDTLLLTAQVSNLTSGTTFRWSTGDTTATVSVVQGGYYWVEVSNEAQCTSSDRVRLKQMYLPDFDLPEDTIACNADLELSFDTIGMNALHRWLDQDGNVLSNSRKMEVNKTGLYLMEAQNQCGIGRDSIHVYFREQQIPNIITPNEDGMNEVFKVKDLGPGTWTFSVYNRWGRRIDQIQSFTGNWDPSVELPELADGTYYYSLRDHFCHSTTKGWFELVK